MSSDLWIQANVLNYYFALVWGLFPVSLWKLIFLHEIYSFFSHEIKPFFYNMYWIFLLTRLYSAQTNSAAAVNHQIKHIVFYEISSNPFTVKHLGTRPPCQSNRKLSETYKNYVLEVFKIVLGGSRVLFFYKTTLN